MRSFRDNCGRKWSITFDEAAVGRAYDQMGVRLARMSGDALLALADDLPRFVGVVFAMVEPQATAAGVAPEDFGRALCGDGIAGAAEAFVRAAIDAHPRDVRRSLQRLYSVKLAMR